MEFVKHITSRLVSEPRPARHRGTPQPAERLTREEMQPLLRQSLRDLAPLAM